MGGQFLSARNERIDIFFLYWNGKYFEGNYFMVVWDTGRGHKRSAGFISHFILCGDDKDRNADLILNLTDKNMIFTEQALLPSEP